LNSSWIKNRRDVLPSFHDFVRIFIVLLQLSFWAYIVTLSGYFSYVDETGDMIK